MTTATPLAPEEPLGAFIGENPNGTWTLTVADDEAMDLGTLVSWGLDIETYSSTPTVMPGMYSQMTAVPIVDALVAASTIDVTASMVGTEICGVTVTTNITHAQAEDIDMTLTSPAGTVVTLTSDNGGTSDNVFNGTVWDDNANPGGVAPYASNDGVVTDHVYVNNVVATLLTPEEGLAAFIGEDYVGTWTLRVSDDTANALVGSIDGWSITINRCLR
jgi:subtilisin-like proprotein convertase family protein